MTKGQAESSAIGETPANEQPEGEFPVVGIGASAGGLAAFEAFFAGMPSGQDPNMAFVLVQHLAPDYKSVLNEIIGRHTRMAVVEAEDGITVEPNCVYIIPPNRDMAFMNGKLQLFEPASPHGQRLPIDFFFHTLAAAFGEKAICIILSGTGSDGTKGMREIKAAGGLVMVQSPDTAEYDGMPRSALETGLVDFELPPREMPEHLMNFIAGRAVIAQKFESNEKTMGENALEKVFVLLRAHTGHDFSKYKPDMIRRRVERRLAVNRIETLAQYIAFMQQSPAEINVLFHALLIGVTSFFRDPEAFAVLEEKVIPDLFRGKPAGDRIRIWVPACSTGEEAYSIAILIQEYLESTKTACQIQIFATDIDSHSIATARAGVYLPQIAEDVSQERLARHFTFDLEQHVYRIKAPVRDMITFSEQSVIKDPPFSRLDLISCRNLLIYMHSKLQAKLFPIFHYALNPNGVLILGPSESLGEFDRLFTPIDRKWKIFRRKENDPIARQLLLATLTDIHSDRETPPADRTASYPADRQPPARKPLLREMVEQAILQELDPVGVLVNENGDILYFYGHTGMFLEPAQGEARISNILKMAREGLTTELTYALDQARSKRAVIYQSRIRVNSNGKFIWANLTVKPIADKRPEAQDNELFLVILEQVPNADLTGLGSDKTDEKSLPTDESRIQSLIRELNVKEKYLKHANEELATSNESLKSANEEMQSINEELQSTNEELETSKEELQSVNEELTTVNAEMQNKILDLSQANNDMSNLMAGTNIATIFVDHQLRIKRFTPSATRIINLISSDIGRPIAHFVTNIINYGSLTGDIKRVLDTLVPLEQQVQSADGRCNVMRIQPYRTTENVIEGAVITFVDITSIKQAQDALAFSEASYRRLFETARDGILIVDPDTGRINDANPFIIQLLGLTREVFINKAIWEIGPFRDVAANRQKFKQLLQHEHVNYELPLVAADGRTIAAEFMMDLFKAGDRMIVHCHFRERSIAGTTP